MSEQSRPTRAWRLFQLLLLTVAAWAATYARVALGPLQESLKASLSLSDHQIALVQGMGLALPLALCSVPLGLLADRASRMRMLLFFMALAVVSCVLTAIASSFAFLLAARALAGLSVAGILVAAYSMAGDLFGATEKGRATMTMAMGELGGAPAAFAIGGALLVMAGSMSVVGFGSVQLDDWRLALLMMGALLIPALLLTFLVREPPRTDIVVAKPALREIWPELWRYRGVALPLQIGRAILFIADGAVYVWGAPLFARNYDLPPDRVGAIMGLVLLAGGLLGPAIGGPLVDFCQRRGGPRRAITLLAVAALLSVPAAMFALIPNPNLAGLVLAIFLILGFTIGAAALALFLIVIPGELRGVNLGISLVVGSIFFVGLAPLAVSGLSAALGGEAMLGKALTIVCVSMSLLNVLVFTIGRRYFPRLEKTPSSPLVAQTQNV